MIMITNHQYPENLSKQMKKMIHAVVMMMIIDDHQKFITDDFDASSGNKRPGADSKDDPRNYDQEHWKSLLPQHIQVIITNTGSLEYWVF